MGKDRHGRDQLDRAIDPERTPQTAAMQRVLATEEGKTEYRPRHQRVVPVFGQIKAIHGFRRFLFRGIEKGEEEWSLVSTCHNLL